ncbi:MAG TPA: cysteine peptidase family C39 domain-containing protein [Candidatus Saccharimonadales bacterium]|nr:cysteine peptidase family C39 domain-containing protein [Candidatus Saccharimonadales bacterium]
MNPWLETGGAALLAATGVALSLWLAKLPKRYWMAAYLVSLLSLGIFGIERYNLRLEFVPPFSWLAAGRMRFILAALAGPILLLTPAAQLPRRRDRRLLGILTGLFLVCFVVMPFFLPALVRKSLARMVTRIDADGVCLQQTSYTCGAAAAVTALHKLGLKADEGAIAIWSRTSQFGVTPDELADALQSHYGAAGLQVRYRAYRTMAELKESGATMAVVKYDVMVDHFVAILGMTNGQVIVGDPLNGKVSYSEEEFSKLWRFCGISLQRIRPMPGLQPAGRVQHGQ